MCVSRPSRPRCHWRLAKKSFARRTSSAFGWGADSGGGDRIWGSPVGSAYFFALEKQSWGWKFCFFGEGKPCVYFSYNVEEMTGYFSRWRHLDFKILLINQNAFVFLPTINSVACSLVFLAGGKALPTAQDTAPACNEVIGAFFQAKICSDWLYIRTEFA